MRITLVSKPAMSERNGVNPLTEEECVFEQNCVAS